MIDVVDALLPRGRQLKSSAHPLVEMTVMDQPTRQRTLVHLVNGTGHQDTAYFPPVALHDLRIELGQEVRRAHAVALDRDLPVTSDGRYWSFTLPRLDAYEVIVVN